MSEILGQEALGRPMTILSRLPPDPEPRHPELERLVSPVEILPTVRELDGWETLFPGGHPREELTSRLARVVSERAEWDHPRFPSLVTEALYLLRRTADLAVAHVHVHFATDAAVAAMLLSDLGGPGYSVTVHAKDIYRDEVDFRILDRIFRRARFVVTVCDANVKYLAERLSPAAMAQVRRVYNGIDVEAWDASDDASREDAHVVAVGRLVEKKGFHVLLQAVSILRASGHAVTATLVGEGEQRPALEALISDRGLSDAVHLTGALDQDGVRRLMRRATLLCLPCVVGEDGNRDALPTVLLEALACGLPVVSTPVGGIQEILDDGRAGVLVPENDPQATARLVAQLLTDRRHRQLLAEAGRRRAAEYFDRRTTAQILASYFDQALCHTDAPCMSLS